MDSKKRLIVTSVISIILVSILMIGSTYSLFNSTDVDQEANVYKLGELVVTVEDAGNVTLDVSKPISNQRIPTITPYRITVKNSGTVAYKFNVILEPTTATDEINHQFIMTKVGQLDPKQLSDCSKNIIKSDIILLPKTSVDIDVRVWISEAVQNTEINKSFSARLKIDGIAAYSTTDSIDNGALVANDVIASRFSYDNSKTGLNCSDVQCAIDALAENVSGMISLGDYVSLTPTKSSYSTDTTMTGYTSSQTIYPKELNLWRVIRINDDGTVEMISEHVSSIDVYFRGQTGYQNFVGYLNVLASQYENSTYTKSSRYFGYNGQTEYITDTSKFTTTVPWTCSTGGSCNPTESQGGGDTLYTTDYDLINTVLGTRVATKPGGSSATYWIASRYYYYYSSTNYSWSGRRVYASESTGISNLYRYYSSSFDASYNCNSLRPIVVLKSGLKYSGVGTKESPLKVSTK